ncbi:MAG: hypothetical protein HY906_19405, partial [Deltaproteobacteria bacterium]|nr:hypothetical protein [Deltaproteobacteria bacterium]
MRAKTLLIVALLGSAATSVRAHQIYTEDCSLEIKDVFQTTDTVCVQGDVDYTCPEGMIDLPGANVYVVPRGGANFTGPPTHFTTMGGFGSFMQITVRTPPLTPGVYDLVLDEHCDGVFDGDDLRVDSAFTVGGGGTCPDAAPGAQRRDPGIPSGAKCRGAC